MSEPAAGSWTARLRVTVSDPSLAEWLERALRPEAAREVPRTRATVGRGPDGSVEVSVSALDSGALRAAMNTYLGWIHLALSTAETARAAGGVRA